MLVLLIGVVSSWEDLTEYAGFENPADKKAYNVH